MKEKKNAFATMAIGLVLFGVTLLGCSKSIPLEEMSQTGTTSNAANDSLLARAYRDKASGVEIEGQGFVRSLLSDDLDGARHQRFILQLDSGQTILIAHNIDIAPRVSPLQVGDVIRFQGEYEWNAQGGSVHWTHHDPAGKHVAGWIMRKGKLFQ
jgi:hypothetical protein